MIPGLNKPLRHCSTSDLVRHAEVPAVRLSQAQRKYSLGLLEEAFILSDKIGIKEASKESGVNVNSLMHYRLIRSREMGRKRQRKSVSINSIDPVKKKACYLMFKRLYSMGFGGKRKCWIEAGERTGVNGRSVEFQYVRGIYTP